MPQGKGPLVLRTNVQFSVKTRSVPLQAVITVMCLYLNLLLHIYIHIYIYIHIKCIVLHTVPLKLCLFCFFNIICFSILISQF